MGTLILSEQEVHEHLPMGQCIEAMSQALVARARGEVYAPLRSVVRAPESAGMLGLMPCHRHGAKPVYALKAVCIFPQNPRLGLDAHQGTVTLFDGDTGVPTAILNASALTSIRTAAVTAVATRALARDDAEELELAVIGSGVQALAHVRALLAVRRFTRVRVYSPTAEHAHRLAQQTAAELAGGAQVTVSGSAEDALRDAAVVVTATNSRTPVLRREWLALGAHVNAIGASIPQARELDSATIAAAELFVDSRESATHEAGDYQLALTEEAIAGPQHIRAELGEVLLGSRPGRSDAQALTVFRSLGLAVEDLAAAELAVDNARRAGAGVEVAL
jgi:ornithine cyclodeaminase/alanine dehydrogenase-like protein (mu-crystallin family)